jgi:PAS domain S-box-containing protein
MAENHPIPLSRFAFRELCKAALAPLLVIELALVLLYFWINAHNQARTADTLHRESVSHLQEIVDAQTRILGEQLAAVADLALALQGETQHFFNTPALQPPPADNPPTFGFAANGVYYQTNNTGGGSLYYSARTAVGPAEQQKAARSAALDPIYKHLFSANKNIVAVYLNTFDSMNRYYPFIESVYEQYLPDMNIPEFNFYYLADAAHNPGRQPVWTETYLDPAGQGWMMSCIAPIYRGDFLEGVAGIDITVKKFLDNILNLSLPWAAEAFLVDGKGTIMAMPNGVERLFGLSELREHVYKAQVAKDTFKPEEFNLLQTKINGVAETVGGLLRQDRAAAELRIGADHFLLAQATEPVTGWKLMVLADKNRILQPIAALEKYATRVGYAAVGGMVFFYSLFFFYLLFNARRVAARISAPVADISARSREIAKGNYDAPLTRSGIAELDQLADNYAAMAAEIKTLHASLSGEINRANLEIAERRHAQEALRASEQKLNAVFNHTLQFLGLMEPDGTVIGANKTALDFVGCDPADVLGKPFWATPWWRHSPAAQEQLRDAVATAALGTPARFETTHVGRDGTTEQIDFSINPVKDEQGRVVFLIPEGRIITALKEAESALRQAKDAAEAANRAKSQFLANMSHEIRTPMNAVIGMTHLAMQVRDEPKRQRFLETVRQSAESLLGLLNDILDFSKMEAGQLSLNRAPFAVEQLLAGVLSTMNVPAAEKGLRLETFAAPGTPPWLCGDDLRLRQILVNLVGNAIKFTARGGVTVRVLQEGGAADDKVMLHFMVADTGIGIPAEKLALIFERFEQVDNSYARLHGGVGLGLSICRQLVALMGGRIWVESRENQGSVFHFVAPLHICQAPPATLETAQETSPQAVVKGLRLLIVDDNEVNRDVASLSLEQDHAATAVANGLEALQALVAADFDAVLMDVQMPVMDGLATAGAIRALEQGRRPATLLPDELVKPLARKLAGRRLPIIAMTAHAMDGDQEMCLAAGMDGYIAKPILPGRLNAALTRLFVDAQDRDQPNPPPAETPTEGLPAPPAPQPSASRPTPEDAADYLRRTTLLPPEQIAKILAAAQASVAANLAAAAEALDRNDYAVLARAAHTLKGTLLQCGLTEWAEQAQQLYNGAKASRDLPYAEQLQNLAQGLSSLIDPNDDRRSSRRDAIRPCPTDE